MAVTAGTTFPIQPLGGSGGVQSHGMLNLPPDPSVEFVAGDVITIDVGTRDAQVAAIPATGILGVVLLNPGSPYTAPATVDRDADWVTVALAHPNRLFEGSLIDTGPNDATGVYATDVRVQLPFLNNGVTGETFLCLEQAGATPAVFTWEYRDPHSIGKTEAAGFGREAGVGKTNPRVSFFFLLDATVFGT